MKVKDAVNIWLLVWTNGKSTPMTKHYFPNKKKSACRIIEHPTTQPNAFYILHDTCKTCQKYVDKIKKDLAKTE